MSEESDHVLQIKDALKAQREEKNIHMSYMQITEQNSTSLLLELTEEKF